MAKRLRELIAISPLGARWAYRRAGILAIGSRLAREALRVAAWLRREEANGARGAGGVERALPDRDAARAARAIRAGGATQERIVGAKDARHARSAARGRAEHTRGAREARRRRQTCFQRIVCSSRTSGARRLAAFVAVTACRTLDTRGRARSAIERRRTRDARKRRGLIFELVVRSARAKRTRRLRERRIESANGANNTFDGARVGRVGTRETVDALRFTGCVRVPSWAAGPACRGRVRSFLIVVSAHGAPKACRGGG